MNLQLDKRITEFAKMPFFPRFLKLYYAFSRGCASAGISRTKLAGESPIHYQEYHTSFNMWRVLRRLR
jgi:hypothetical protein